MTEYEELAALIAEAVENLSAQITRLEELVSELDGKLDRPPNVGDY